MQYLLDKEEYDKLADVEVMARRISDRRMDLFREKLSAEFEHFDYSPLNDPSDLPKVGLFRAIRDAVDRANVVARQDITW